MSTYSYTIVTDTTTDLTEQWMNENGVGYLPHGLVIDGKEIKDDFGKTIPPAEFYQRIREGMMPTTTQVDIPTFTRVYEGELQKGKDVVYIGFSSQLSGTFNTSNMVAKELMEKYPGRKIISYDTKAATMGQGALVMEAVKMQQQGLSLEEMVEKMDHYRETMCHFFTVDDLNHLYRGGRVSKTSAFLGTLVGIKPVMYMSEEGRLLPLAKVRGRGASMQDLARLCKEYIVDPQEQTVYCVHGGCPEDAGELCRMIEEAVHPKHIDIRGLTPIIGSHTGPGVLAIMFFGSKRI
ncbi:DegV family protein [Acidaminobacterium chupaoyuni]